MTLSHVLMETSITVMTKAGWVFALQQPPLGAFCPRERVASHRAREESETPQAETLPEILVRASHPPPQKFHNPAHCKASGLPNMLC